MMYWSVIGDHSHLEESAMDGSLRRVILEKNLRRPTGQYFMLEVWIKTKHESLLDLKFNLNCLDQMFVL